MTLAEFEGCCAPNSRCKEYWIKKFSFYFFVFCSSLLQMSFSGWYPSVGRSSDPNEEASSDDKYNVVSSDYVVTEMNASH